MGEKRGGGGWGKIYRNILLRSLPRRRLKSIEIPLPFPRTKHSEALWGNAYKSFSVLSKISKFENI